MIQRVMILIILKKRRKRRRKKKLNIKKPIDDVEYQWKVADTFDAFKQRVSKQSKRFACIVFPDKILKLSKKRGYGIEKIFVYIHTTETLFIAIF